MLAPCLDCRRHVRSDEPSCPFCGGAIGAAKLASPLLRPTRAAIIFASAVSIAGCSEDTSEVAIYGAPAPDSALTDTSAKDSSPADSAAADTTTPDTAPSDSATSADSSEADTLEDTRVLPPYGAPSPHALV